MNLKIKLHFLKVRISKGIYVSLYLLKIFIRGNIKLNYYLYESIPLENKMNLIFYLIDEA